MQALQVQINEINQKVERLWEIVRQLRDDSIATSPSGGASLPEIPALAFSEKTSLPSHSPIPPLTEHKDIISDEYIEFSCLSPSIDTLVTEDVQIRRLTAQLTAAYNRIAALEEQLIAKRIRN